MFQHQQQQQQVVDTFILGLPPGFSNWFQVPANPLMAHRYVINQALGPDAGKRTKKEDFNFYCDACQRGFMHEQQYNAHCEEHLYCEVPGCNFTCRKDRAWKMEMHVETLHNRVDAPNLADSSKYIADRKKRFPTSEVVEAKTEELTLKAARGEILPDERRRWLRRFGVIVKKDGKGIIHLGEDANNNNKKEKSKEELELEEKRKKEKQERRDARLRRVAIALNAKLEKEEGVQTNLVLNENQNHQNQNQNQNNNNNNNTHHRTVAMSDDSRHIIPMGANGRLTKAQQVQLVRDKYRAAVRVPNFYVRKEIIGLRTAPSHSR
jgi:hypothetical protein